MINQKSDEKSNGAKESHKSNIEQNRELLFGKRHSVKKEDEAIGRFGIIMIGLAALLILFNQYQISSVSAMLNGGGAIGFSIGTSSRGISLFSGDGGVIIGPQLNSDGRTTKLVEWPTISEVPKPQESGDPSQDAINYIIPTGIPWYLAEGPGADLGISFDDPIPAQKVWGALERSIQLDSEQQQRYNKLTSVFTCDYCCGGPNSVTTINRCGCAHAYAWKGMARFFIKYYGDKYSDEEILGEMTRWKGLWYPKGMIQDYLVYTGQADANTLRHGGSVGIRAQFSGQGGGGSSASISGLENLPGMVGGC